MCIDCADDYTCPGCGESCLECETIAQCKSCYHCADCVAVCED